jgi:hypothetical protein
MGKVVIFLIVLLIAAFFANYYKIVSIPYLDLPEVSTYSGDVQRTDDALKKINE